MTPGMKRIVTFVLLGVVPVVTLAAMLMVAHPYSIALDFRNELYPEAKEILAGRNPFPVEGADLYRGKNLIWPPLAALLAAPLTLFSPMTANVLIALIGLACYALTLWIVGVRDWRVFGAFALWPQVAGEMRVGHLTPVLCLLVAVAWRYRDRDAASGLAVGVAGAVKFFLWPVGLWLIAIGRARAALIAAVFAGASLLLVLPFTGLDDYFRTLIDLGRTFDQDSYSLFGLLMQLEAPEMLARAVMLVTGAAALVYLWRRESFTAAIAAALLLSPIVWLDFYALAAVPLAIVRPRFAIVWLVPLVTWGLPSSGIGAGTAWGVTRALVAFTIVFAVIVRAEREATRDAGNHAATVRGVANRRLEPRSSPD